MAYNFLSLVNNLCQATNEVELSASNFSSVDGIYNDFKRSINDTIAEINAERIDWPFNHTRTTLVLTAGVNRYAFPANAEYMDFNTFRIHRDDTIGNSTSSLKEIDYDTYIKYYSDDEYNTTNSSIRGLPNLVSVTQGMNFVVWRVPDAAYTLEYEYFSLPTDLVAYSDTPTIPEQFKYVIIAGALRHSYNFKDDIEVRDRISTTYETGLKAMRRTYISRAIKLKDTMIVKSPKYADRFGP